MTCVLDLIEFGKNYNYNAVMLPFHTVVSKQAMQHIYLKIKYVRSAQVENGFLKKYTFPKLEFYR
jgi:hypothetical protein